MRNIRRRRGGLTLLEVLLVLVILVVIGGMIGVSISGAQKRAMVDTTKTQINTFKTLLESYRLDVGTLPTTLEGLVAPPADLKSPDKWRGPYGDKTIIPKDPWDNDFVYTTNGDTFTLSSAGPDRAPGTADDIAIN